ncbi:MAG: rod shape-determining protein MreC [Christensenellales bacterium]|jgi:rod shape-determining protein MreC
MRRLRTRAQTRRMRGFISAGVIVVVSVLLIVSSMSGWINLSFLSVIPQHTIIPVKNFIEKTVADFRSVFADSTLIAEENQRLHQELSRMELELAGLSELKAENQRLRQLLQIDERGEFEYVGARVMAMTPGNWLSEFSIDKGSGDGMREGMPVVTSKGLVGKITEVAPGMSMVRAVVDSRSALAGIVERTRDNGVVNGILQLDGSGGLLRMMYLSSETELAIGDRVLTSGLEGEYPKGLLIGTISQVSRGTASESGYVIISPAADFLRIEEVLVITNAQPAAEAEGGQ